MAAENPARNSTGTIEAADKIRCLFPLVSNGNMHQIVNFLLLLCLHPRPTLGHRLRAARCAPSRVRGGWEAGYGAHHQLDRAHVRRRAAQNLKVIPHLSDEKNAIKLVFATLIRVSDRRQRRQFSAIRGEAIATGQRRAGAGRGSRQRPTTSQAKTPQRRTCRRMIV